MRLSRVVIKNFRSFVSLDAPLTETSTCVIGENNTGKTNFLHAIRLCLDASLSSTYRSLISSDIHSSIDITYPNQVLIGIEITDFSGKPNEEALVGAWQSKPGLARLIYRFRPKLAVREDLEEEEKKPGELTITDYQWEILGGGDPSRDLTDIEWDDDIGSSIRFADLQAFLVVYLPALRDVESDLRQFRSSPLARLIEAIEISDAEKDTLLAALKSANNKIAKSNSISAIATAIDTSLKSVAGPAFSMKVALGLAEPSFQSIVRALRILLTNGAQEDFDPASNGLGLNNILYVSILFEYFRKRIAQEKSAGQIILFEEPEAHLHPQLQLSLFKAICALPFQSILTTHSTHITAHADLASYVTLTHTADCGTVSSVPNKSSELSNEEILDLERYLDATRSNLLFARKVMLVEGPAEMFLFPALVKNVLDIDLDREGISVIPIYGVHFDAYAKLFSAEALPKKCAIVADGDLIPSDADANIEGEDTFPEPTNLKKLENDYVRVFQCQTTFERALTQKGTLDMLALTAEEIGAVIIAKRLRDGISSLAKGTLGESEEKKILNALRTSVLNTAKRFGKARFAQVASKHVGQATSLPKYLKDAVTWLREP